MFATVVASGASSQSWVSPYLQVLVQGLEAFAFVNACFEEQRDFGYEPVQPHDGTPFLLLIDDSKSALN